MEITRLDDYQSWMFQAGTTTVVLDPWLEGTCTLPGGSWVFERKHRTPPAFAAESLPPLRALFLSAHFGDHFHEPTLEKLPRDIPTYTTRWAAKRLLQIGFTNVQVLHAGDTISVSDELHVRAVAPAFPYKHNSLGFVFEDQQDGTRVLVETHGIRLGQAAENQPIQRLDAIITAIESVWFLGIRFTLGEKRLLRVLRTLGPTRVIPTGTEPEAATGFLPRFLLYCSGSIAQFRKLLAQTLPSTTLLQMEPGARITLTPSSSKEQ